MNASPRLPWVIKPPILIIDAMLNPRLGVVALVLHGSAALHMGGAPTVSRMRVGSIVMKAEALPHDFITVHTTFDIKDWDAAWPICKEFFETKAKSEQGLMYFGWDTTRSEASRTVVGGFATVPGDKLFCRQAFADGASVMAHLDNIQDTTQALNAGPCLLSEVQLHGPASELALCKAAANTLGARCFEIIPGGHSLVKKVSGGVPLPLQLTCVNSMLCVKDWDKAQPLLDDFLARSSKEDQCVYCGITRDGNDLTVREAYGSIVSLARHVENAGECIDALLEGGSVTLERSDVHGTLNNIRQFRDEFLVDTGRAGMYGSVKPRLFYREAGVQQFEVQQSMFGFRF